MTPKRYHHLFIYSLMYSGWVTYLSSKGINRGYFPGVGAFNFSCRIN